MFPDLEDVLIEEDLTESSRALSEQQIVTCRVVKREGVTNLRGYGGSGEYRAAMGPRRRAQHVCQVCTHLHAEAAQGAQGVHR